MKKIFLSSLAFFAFFLASCQDDRMFEDAPTLPGQQTAKIYVDSDGESSDSRITHDYASNEHYWQEKDSLSVFMRDGKNRLFQLVEGAGTQSGGFIGLIWSGTGDPSSANFPNNVAFYPYNKDLKVTYSGGVYSLTSVLPSKQTFGGDGTFAQYAFPMIGVTEDNTRINYQLKAVTSAAILHLRSNSDKKISKIVLKANGRKIAGQFTTKTAYNESPVTVATEEAVDYVALECNPPVQLNSETAVKFWFTVLPTAYEAGDLTVDIYDSEGGYCKDLNISPYGSNTHELKQNVRKNFGRDEGKYIYYTPQGNLKTEFLNAVKNAQSGETVQYQLQSNLILDEEVDIKKGVTVDLDLNGYTITSNISKKTGYKKGNYCWYIYQGTGKSDKGGVLKIKNGTLETPVEETANSLGYQLIHCDQWAKLELENVTIEHNQVDGEGSGTAICFWNNSNLTARNTNVTSKNYCLYSSHTSTDPTIENIIDGGTYISQESHVIYGNPAARVTIYDGNFKTLNSNKQCVYITMAYYKSMTTIKGGKFGDNKYSHVGWTGSNDPEYPFAPAVASKSVDTFEELLAAIDEAASGNNSMGVIFTADIEGNGKSIVIPENTNIAFNLNKYSLVNPVKGAPAIINNGTSTFSNGTILNGNTEAQESSVIFNTGTLMLDKMTVGSEENRGAAVVNKGGEVTINGGTYNSIDAGNASSRAAEGNNGFAYVFVNNGGTMTIKNVTSVGNPHGIFYASDGLIVVEGGTYTLTNENGNAGYLAYATGDGEIKLNTGDFTWTAPQNQEAEATNGNVNVGAEAEIEGWIDGVKEENDVVEISTLRGLMWVRDQVNNEGNYFAGKTVKLVADIDLNNVEWAPIGLATTDHGFMGNFDGNGKTIKNLSITKIAPDSDGYVYAGLFGVTEGTDANNQNYIKDLTIENVNIDLKGDIVAAAIAYPYYTSVENVTVKGNVNIKGGNYTAGVLAYTRRCVNAKNLTIEGNNGSSIEGNLTVGGVISDIQMNGGLTANYSNFAASGLSIKGAMHVGGISGIICKQTLNGATVENVEIVCDDVRKGIISGSLGDTSTITNITANGVSGATNIIGGTYKDGSKVIVIGDVYELPFDLREKDGIYEIASANGLKELATKVNGGDNFKGKTVKLVDDIDLNSEEWTPIGKSNNSFNGTFDGNGKTISNLVINGGSESDKGLFGVTKDGEIKNLTVNNAKVSGRLDVAVVAGTPYTSKYTNIKVTGHVEVNGMAYVGTVGGKNAYASWTDVTVDVDNSSYVKANSVENGTAYRTYVGGVCGFNGEGNHTFTNITSNINVEGSTCDAGGLFGIAHYGNSFVNCHSTGNVKITNASEAAEAEEMGGIAGVWHNENGQTVSFTGCSFTGKLTANITEGVDLTDNTIVGAAYSATGTGSLVIDGVKVVDAGWAFVAEGVRNFGNGYQLSNKAGLVWFRDQVGSGNSFAGKTVTLTADIDLNNEEWAPIGGSDGYTNNFAGTFDGDNHTISNLKVNNSSCAGLFGTMCGGAIKNLTVDGAVLNSNHYAGAIIAWMEKGSKDFTIENCHVKDAIITLVPDKQANGKYDNGDKAGAIAGFMHHGVISNCTATDVEITAYRDLGGIIGYANKSTITNNQVNGAKLTIDQVTNYYDDKTANVGQIIGRRGEAPTESGNTYSNVTIDTKTAQQGNFNKVVVGGEF